MANEFKSDLLGQLERRLGPLKRLAGSLSLLETASGSRIYLRYSKMHNGRCAFYGLRRVDLNALEGHDSHVCLFTDDPQSPLFLPYADFEVVIRQSPLANDGQYKVQLIFDAGTRELYLPRVGSFNVDAYGGIETLLQAADVGRSETLAALSHGQVQTLLGAIGHLKGYSVYVPPSDCVCLDWALAPRFNVVAALPPFVHERAAAAAEIDVIWLDHSSSAVSVAFEVEHSTPVYSGLLRFNDVHLTCFGVPRYFVVSNESRRDLFARQVQRPTFQRSGLAEMVSFLEYANVLDWHRRLSR